MPKILSVGDFILLRRLEKLWHDISCLENRKYLINLYFITIFKKMRISFYKFYNAKELFIVELFILVSIVVPWFYHLYLS
jgi:hypothetical protein